MPVVCQNSSLISHDCPWTHAAASLCCLPCPLNICCHFLYLHWFISVEGDSSSASLGSAVILKYVRGVWIWGNWNFLKAKFCPLKPNTCILSGQHFVSGFEFPTHIVWHGAHMLMLNVSYSTLQVRLGCVLCTSANLGGSCSSSFSVLLSQLWAMNSRWASRRSWSFAHWGL